MFVTLGLVPLLMLWKYIALRRRLAEFDSMQIDRGALALTRRDQSVLRLPWSELSLLTGEELRFGAEPALRIPMYIFANTVWVACVGRLRKTHASRLRERTDGETVRLVWFTLAWAAESSASTGVARSMANSK